MNDYAAKKRAAMEKAAEIRRRREEEEYVQPRGGDALDSHMTRAKVTKTRVSTRSDHGDYPANREGGDALDGYMNGEGRGLVKTPPVSPGVTHPNIDEPDALDGLMGGRVGGDRRAEVRDGYSKTSRQYQQEMDDTRFTSHRGHTMTFMASSEPRASH